MRWTAAWMCSVVLLLAGCGSDSSPASPSALEGISIIGETLVPAGDQICHVRGTIVNDRADVTVDIIMRWRALDGSANEIATTKLRVLNVGPGTRQDFESTGFASNSRGLIGCGDIIRFERFETTISTH